MEDLPPQSSNGPPSQGFTQTLPQPTPMDFEPFFPPINLSRRGGRMSAQPEPLLSRDQVLQELGQYQDFDHHLKAAIQNTQNVQNNILPPFTTISSQMPPMPSSFYSTTISTTAIPSLNKQSHHQTLFSHSINPYGWKVLLSLNRKNTHALITNVLKRSFSIFETK
ncbi:hypothetical protein Tco_0257671 [Tanacetum coccineum]